MQWLHVSVLHIHVGVCVCMHMCIRIWFVAADVNRYFNKKILFIYLLNLKQTGHS